jgi:sigma-B regulation protein RsbU (phosphoserine phosphatase)
MDLTTLEAHRATSRHLSRELLEHELDLARQVQESLFPLELPSVGGVRLAAVNLPARIVSGDLYDVIKIDSSRIVILCADVSGKGFAAALLAAELHAFCRSMLQTVCGFVGGAPAALPLQVVTLLNQIACQSQRRDYGRYATLFFAEFDASERLLRYVNAGQNAPLVVGPGLPIQQLTTGGPPVGLFEDSVYEAGTVALPDGALLLAYTDGAVEARNGADEEFGLARLIDLCSANYQQDVDGLLSRILQAVITWSSDTEQADDVTLVALARRTSS